MASLVAVNLGSGWNRSDPTQSAARNGRIVAMRFRVSLFPQWQPCLIGLAAPWKTKHVPLSDVSVGILLQYLDEL